MTRSNKWYRRPPSDRRFALIWTGEEYAIAQWEPKLNVWAYWDAYNLLQIGSKTLWHPLPPPPGYKLDNRVYELWENYGCNEDGGLGEKGKIE